MLSATGCVRAGGCGCGPIHFCARTILTGKVSYPALSGVPYPVTAKKRLVNREKRILNGGPTAGLPPTASPTVEHHHPRGMGLSPKRVVVIYHIDYKRTNMRVTIVVTTTGINRSSQVRDLRNGHPEIFARPFSSPLSLWPSILCARIHLAGI